MKRSSVVHSDPDILGGTPVFVGTLEEFLDDFPTVSRELAIGALDMAAHFVRPGPGVGQ